MTDLERWEGPVDPAEFEIFLDTEATALMETYHVKGMTVSLVKDGELFLSKGYGTTDIEGLCAVSPSDTLFRIGSVSKLFTWTSVMQLIEEGKIDLDADINNYLKHYRVPDAFGQPVTMRHLMTHTAGFDESARVGSYTDLGNGPIEDYLNATMPQRIRAPGELISYSNHGVTLAALAVQDVSGMTYYEYVAKHILEPLGMCNTSLAQPLPSSLADRLSSGFIYDGDKYLEGEFEYLRVMGAGEVSSTAEDMARFMLMHLQNGAYGNVRILNEATAREMHSLQFRSDPQAYGFCLGFYQTGWRDNVTMIGHGGDTALFHTQLQLFPEHGMGIFVSTNTASGSGAASRLVMDLVDRYFPVEKRVLPAPGPDALNHARTVAGVYLDARTEHTTIGKYIGKANEWIVGTSEDGYLTIRTGSANYKLVEVSPYRYAILGVDKFAGGDVLFLFDSNGRPDRFVFTDCPVYGTYERMDVVQQQGFINNLLIVAEALMISSVLWLGVGLYRWKKSAPKNNAAMTLKGVLLIACGLSFLFVLLLGQLDMATLEETWAATLDDPQPLWSYRIIPAIVLIALFGSMVLGMVAAWHGETWKRWEKVHVVVVMGGLACFMLWTYYWKLM